MHKTLRTVAQVTDLYSTLTSDIPGSIISNLILMILERIEPNERTRYIEKMKHLAQKGYDSYNKDRKRGVHHDLGIPIKRDLLDYISSCFKNHKVPNPEGLQEKAKASPEEAKVLMTYLERAWVSDTEYITATQILACIAEVSKLQENYDCFRAFTHEQISDLQNSLVAIHEIITKQNNPFAEYIDALKQFKYSCGTLYDYTSETVTFIGRVDELKALERFCEDSRKVLWWSITGSGGVGKSRLAYELCKRMTEKEWKCVFLTKAAFKKVTDFSAWKYYRNLLVVIDYAAYHGKKIGQWIEAICSMDESQMSKIRILLIERAKSQQIEFNVLHPDFCFSVPWIKEIQKGIVDTDLLEYTCFDKTFIQLKPLDDFALREIVMEATRTSGKSMTESEIAQLLSSLKRLDPDLRRPLHLLFLVQIWIDNPKKILPSRFTELAEYICKKELKRVQEIMADDSHIECAETLMLMATITQEFSFEDPSLMRVPVIRAIIERSSSLAYSNSRLRSDLQRLFEIVDNTCVITPIQPSLIGEYFVMRTFQDKPQVLTPIIQAAWQYSPRATTVFLERIIVDFYEFSGHCQYYGIADLTNGIFQKPQIDDEETETYYADLLVDLSATTVDAENAIAAATFLQGLYIKYPSSIEIWICFAKALMNLTNKSITVKDMQNSILILNDIASRKDAPMSVKIELAKALFNLGRKAIDVGLFTSIDSIVSRLEELWIENNTFEIGLRYVKGLFYLQLQLTDDDEELLNKIREIIERYDITEETGAILIDVIVELGMDYHNATQRMIDIQRLMEISNTSNAIPNIVVKCHEAIQLLETIQDTPEKNIPFDESCTEPTTQV